MSAHKNNVYYNKDINQDPVKSQCYLCFWYKTEIWKFAELHWEKTVHSSNESCSFLRGHRKVRISHSSITIITHFNFFKIFLHIMDLKIFSNNELFALLSFLHFLYFCEDYVFTKTRLNNERKWLHFTSINPLSNVINLCHVENLVFHAYWLREF